MSDAAGARVTALYRYPVKGMTPHRMERVSLVAGETMPFDRAYAIENGPGRFNPEAPKHLPKINFVMLMRNERLATLSAEFDDATETLTIRRAGKQVARGQLSTALGRQMVEQFLAAYMAGDMRGAPRIVRAPGHSFSDVAAKCVHIVNLASVRDLERVLGRAVNPLRFRPNVVIDGAEAWREFDWVDKRITLGGVTLEAFARTDRCDATNVDPETGARDMAIPSALLRQWRHSDFGIYARVVGGGELTAGDAVTVS